MSDSATLVTFRVTAVLPLVSQQKKLATKAPTCSHALRLFGGEALLGALCFVIAKTFMGLRFLYTQAFSRGHLVAVPQRRPAEPFLLLLLVCVFWTLQAATLDINTIPACLWVAI